MTPKPTFTTTVLHFLLQIKVPFTHRCCHAHIVSCHAVSTRTSPLNSWSSTWPGKSVRKSNKSWEKERVNDIHYQPPYLKTGMGYDCAGHRSVMVWFIRLSMPDHFTSLDNVGAFALIGSSNEITKYQFWQYFNLNAGTGNAWAGQNNANVEFKSLSIHAFLWSLFDKAGAFDPTGSRTEDFRKAHNLNTYQGELEYHVALQYFRS